MALDHWLAFLAAAALLLAIPGPTVLLVVSYALAHGRRAAWAVAAGVALGDFTAMTASMLGLGAILAASAAVFTALRWAGGAYLVFLGVRLWRAPVDAVADVAPDRVSRGRMLSHAFAVTALNPKGLVFFVAFVPQFLDARAPLLPQVVTLEATFIALAGLNVFVYASAAATARRALRREPVRRAVNRAGAALLIGAGLAAAGWRGANA